MNNVTFNILLLFLQIYCTSELGGGKITGGKGSHVGDLIRTKSGKVFLRRSSKKALSSKKNAADDEEDANDGKASDKSFPEAFVFEESAFLLERRRKTFPDFFLIKCPTWDPFPPVILPPPSSEVQ